MDTATASFPLTLTVRVGNFKTAFGDLLKALRATGHELRSDATELLLRAKIPLSTEEREINVVLTTPSAMGFFDLSTNPRQSDVFPRHAVFKRATEQGLRFCPAEAAPQLVLQHASALRELINARPQHEDPEDWNREVVFFMEPLETRQLTERVFAIKAAEEGLEFIATHAGMNEEDGNFDDPVIGDPILVFLGQ